MESANNMNAGYEVTAFMSKQRSGLRMSTVMTYTKVNGYLIPNLTYKSGEQMEQLGKYGFLRRDYLKNLKKKLTTLQAQDAEIRTYEEKIHHVAD